MVPHSMRCPPGYTKAVSDNEALIFSSPQFRLQNVPNGNLQSISLTSGLREMESADFSVSCSPVQWSVGSPRNHVSSIASTQDSQVSSIMWRDVGRGNTAQSRISTPLQSFVGSSRATSSQSFVGPPTSPRRSPKSTSLQDMWGSLRVNGFREMPRGAELSTCRNTLPLQIVSKHVPANAMSVDVLGDLEEGAKTSMSPRKPSMGPTIYSSPEKELNNFEDGIIRSSSPPRLRPRRCLPSFIEKCKGREKINPQPGSCSVRVLHNRSPQPNTSKQIEVHGPPASRSEKADSATNVMQAGSFQAQPTGNGLSVSHSAPALHNGSPPPYSCRQAEAHGSTSNPAKASVAPDLLANVMQASSFRVSPFSRSPINDCGSRDPAELITSFSSLSSQSPFFESRRMPAAIIPCIAEIHDSSKKESCAIDRVTVSTPRSSAASESTLFHSRYVLKSCCSENSLDVFSAGKSCGSDQSSELDLDQSSELLDLKSVLSEALERVQDFPRTQGLGDSDPDVELPVGRRSLPSDCLTAIGPGDLEQNAECRSPPHSLSSQSTIFPTICEPTSSSQDLSATKVLCGAAPVISPPKLSALFHRKPFPQSPEAGPNDLSSTSELRKPSASRSSLRSQRTLSPKRSPAKVLFIREVLPNLGGRVSCQSPQRQSPRTPSNSYTPGYAPSNSYSVPCQSSPRQSPRTLSKSYYSPRRGYRAANESERSLSRPKLRGSVSVPVASPKFVGSARARSSSPGDLQVHGSSMNRVTVIGDANTGTPHAPNIHPTVLDSSLKLVVFDFDCTLAAFHMFSSLAGIAGACKLTVPSPYAKTEIGQLSRLCNLEADPKWGPGVFALRAFGGQSRVTRLRSVLKELSDANIECIVLSRGMVGPIKMCLEHLDMLHFFARIVGNRGSSQGVTEHDHNLTAASLGAAQRCLGNPDEDYGGKTGSKSEHIQTYMKERGFEFHQVVFVDDDLKEIIPAQSVCRTIHVTSGIGVQENDFQLLLDMLT